MKKIIILILFITVGWQHALAQTFTSDGLFYNVTSSSSVEVGSNSSATGDIIIPATVTNNGTTYYVTSIADNAFSNCSTLNTVVIGNSVTSIGQFAFAISSLTSVIIPNSVTTIGYSAFNTCTNLTSVTIPNSVTSIEGSAFSDCTSLTSVTIPNSVTSIGFFAFSSCYGLTSVTIPNSVTSIEISAFRGCSSLVSVTIPDSVTSIQSSAFRDCSSLTSVTIPNSVYLISNELFKDCTSLTSVTIPDSILYIQTAAFSGCSGLTSVTIPESVYGISDEAFLGCTGLNSVICRINTPVAISANVFANVNQAACSLTVPSGSVAAYEAAAVWQYFNPIIAYVPVFNTTTVTACEGYTWTNTNQTYTVSGVYTGTTTNGVTEQLDLTIVGTNFSIDGINYSITSPTTVEVGNNSGASGDIVIPATVTTGCGTYFVTSIRIAAFNSSGLTSIIIPNSVTSIGNLAFINTHLTSITIPDSVNSIGDSTFENCLQLTSVTIPNSVEIIGNSAFENCLQLTSVTIPNSVEIIGNSAFYNCISLTSVTISNSVTIIEDHVFSECQSLTSLTIPDSVISINDSAFRNCTSLTSVTIPNSVTVLGSSAFINCSSLTSVTIPNSVTEIGSSAFRDCFSLTSVTIPNSVTVLGSSAFRNCSSLTSVTIPNSVTEIGSSAFRGCTSLTSFICNVISPIDISSNVFRDVNQAACSLIVPAGSVAAYQAAPVWQNFRFPANNNLSRVIDSQCGAILPALNTLIRANAITGATKYRFKVVNGATTETIEPTTSARWFRLTSLPGGTFYNTAYTISVAVKKNNVWGDYGDECMVTTPAFPATKVQNSQCGTTLASINTLISADRIWNYTGYRFKVVNESSTQTIEAASGSRWFRLTSLSGGASYNTTYTISVATRYNGVWSEYGEECTVTTPAALLSKLQDRQCGITLVSGNAALLYANPVRVAQKYRFEVSLGADVYTYDTASSSVRSFRMTEVPGLTLVSGTTYGVRVAIMVNDAWQPYGESCNITTYSDNPNFVKTMNLDTTNFNVITYPNPFTENFNLNLTSLSEEKVTVMVYDMTGKLLEKKEVVPSELFELQVGTNFASGVYNVIVSQGENTKSLRVIKK